MTFIPTKVLGLADLSFITTNKTPISSTNPVFYVNSLTGSDANDGLTPATALATPTSKLGVANATILLYSGGEYRLGAINSSGSVTGGIQFTADGITIDSYGPAPIRGFSLDGALPTCAFYPTIKGSKLMGVWTNDGTSNNTYSTAFTDITDTTKTKVYVDAGPNETAPLRTATTLANCRATPGTFFVTGGLMYLHLADNTNPNTHVIEASVKDYGIIMGKNNNLTIRNVRLMHYNHIGIFVFNLNYEAAAAGSNHLIENVITINNGLSDSVTDPTTSDTTDGHIVAFTGNFNSSQTIVGLTIKNCMVGRRDTESMVLNDHGGGITVMSVSNCTVANNLVRTINGHGIVCRKYFNGIQSGNSVTGNEVTKSQGHVYMVSNTNSSFTYNNIHDGAGNCQFGSNLNQITAHNIVHDMVSAFGNGLYNGFDDQSSINTLEFGNRIWRVANFCSTRESDSGVGSTGMIFDNYYDSSQNLLPNGNAPDTSNIVGPVYCTLASLTGGLSGYGNTLIPNILAGNLVAWWGAVNAGDHGPIYTEAQFSLIQPGMSLGSYGNFKQAIGAQAAPSVTKTAAYTIVTTDYLIRVNASSAPVTITLPASPLNNEIHIVKKIDSSINTVTISGNGHNIDGGTTQVLSTQWSAYTIQYDTVAAIWSIY